MKRIFVYTLLTCLLLLTGCDVLPTPSTQPTAPATESTTASPTKPTAASSEETVTVYLLEKFGAQDIDHAEFSYDEQHNLISAKHVLLSAQTEYTDYFENPDENGMPASVRRCWSDGNRSNTLLTYTADGKLNTVEKTSFPLNGYTFSYDDEGRLIDKSYLFNNRAEWSLLYDYTDGTLTAARCVDADGTPLYKITVKAGRVVKESYTEAEDTKSYSYTYQYDKHGNLSAKRYTTEDGTVSVTHYTYKAVKVPADRAPYLLEQQNHFLTLDQALPFEEQRSQ